MPRQPVKHQLCAEEIININHVKQVMVEQLCFGFVLNPKQKTRNNINRPYGLLNTKLTPVESLALSQNVLKEQRSNVLLSINFLLCFLTFRL